MLGWCPSSGRTDWQTSIYRVIGNAVNSQLIDSRSPGFEEGHEVPGERGPVAPEHLRRLEFKEYLGKTKARQEEQEIGFSLQPPQFPVIPFIRFDF